MLTNSINKYFGINLPTGTSIRFIKTIIDFNKDIKVLLALTKLLNF